MNRKTKNWVRLKMRSFGGLDCWVVLGLVEFWIGFVEPMDCCLVDAFLYIKLLGVFTLLEKSNVPVHEMHRRAFSVIGWLKIWFFF